MLSRPKMIEVLASIQNRAPNHNRDILTITGFMSHDEVGAHVMAEFCRLSQSDKKEVFSSLARRPSLSIAA